MMSLTGIRGLSEPNGSWKTICIAAAHLPERLRLERGDVHAPEDDRPGGRLGEAEDRAAEGRLAAAGLADEAEDLALADVEV